MAKRVESIELGEHLLRRLGARHPPVQFDDVAELAGERTAARELHAGVDIIAGLEQIEARGPTGRDISLELLCLEHTAPRAGVPGAHEFIDQPFELTDHPNIRVDIGMRRRRHVRTTDGDRLAAQIAERDNTQRVWLLWQHATGHHQVGPVQVAVVKLLGVAVDEAESPLLR